MFKSRIGILAILLGLCFAGVIGRLFQLQIIRYEQYAALSEKDRGAERIVPALRAPILDRYGTILAEDRPFFDLSVRIDRLKLQTLSLADVKAARDPKLSSDDRKARAEALQQRLLSDPFIINLSATTKYNREELARAVYRAFDNVVRTPKPWAAPNSVQTIASGIEPDVWLSLRSAHEDVFRNPAQLFSRKEMEKQKEPLPEPPFPGLVCTVSTRRIYPRATQACFVLGGEGEISEDEMESLRLSGVLLEANKARTAAWTKIRAALSAGQAAQLNELLQEDPREIDDAGVLYRALSRLSPQQLDQAAQLGLADPVRWMQRPARIKLVEPEALWLGIDMPVSATGGSLPNRRIGEMGVERLYNDWLRGKSGIQYAQDSISDDLVPAAFETSESAVIRKKSAPEEGHPLRLSISAAWQEAVERALASQNFRGAAVVMDCRNGEVLALASNPPYDPNDFTPPRNVESKQARIKDYFENPEKPMLNRAISGEYPLGSIMKSLVLAAALEKGLLTPEETFDCPGFIKEGGQIFHCDGNHAHGTVNVFKCLRCSCNVMSHQVGARLGCEGLAPFAKLILGKRTGIDLPAEASGVYPDKAWRLKTFPDNPKARTWTKGQDFLLAIGQGQMNATVLQAAVLMGAIGNGGYVVTPRLNLDAPAAKPVFLGISQHNLSYVQRGLDECVNIGTPGERGTCYAPFHQNGPELPIRVAGKTSTAEHKKGAAPHAWFAGYAPADNPQFSFCVMLEEAGHGGQMAGPVAYKFLKEVYGTKQNPNPKPGAPKDGVAAVQER